MLFTITGKHIEITDALRDYCENKTSKLPKFYDNVTEAEVVIESGVDGSKTRVEIIVRAEHKNAFVVEEVGDDAYACIDLAVHKLERQLRREKTKERDNKHSGA